MNENLLDKSETLFLKRRKQMMRLWPLVGLSLFAMPVGLGAWLFFQVPLLGNPAFVMQGIKNGTTEFSSLSLMAGMLPVLVLACLASLLCAVACLFAVIAGERKYLKIIEKLTRKLTQG